MTETEEGVSTRTRRVLITEEAVCGLILVSGMIVVSNNPVGTSINPLVTVFVTVVVFFAAHVYAGTIARLAQRGSSVGFRQSVIASLHHSEGMLLASIVPLLILVLGVSRFIDDEVAIWAALIVDTLLLAILDWLAIARWTRRIELRLAGAATTAAFGVAIVLLKSLVHH
ncbi:MAG: hypothetical protein QM622_12330 [Microbacterium sp.]